MHHYSDHPCLPSASDAPHLKAVLAGLKTLAGLPTCRRRRLARRCFGLLWQLPLLDQALPVPLKVRLLLQLEVRALTSQAVASEYVGHC